MVLGKDARLIRLFQKNFSQISFVWCFSHRLELALKDVLNYLFEPVKKTLQHFQYIYRKSSKKHSELENLYELLMCLFEMYNAGMLPLKTTDTQWINHKLGAMGKVIEEFAKMQHLQNVIDTTSNLKKFNITRKIYKVN